MTTQPHQGPPEKPPDRHSGHGNDTHGQENTTMPRDRYGDEVDNTHPTRAPHNTECRSGWLGENLDGHPIPCLQCRPHLARTTAVHNLGAAAAWTPRATGTP